MDIPNNTINDVTKVTARTDRLFSHYADTAYHCIEDLRVEVPDAVLAKAKEFTKDHFWNSQSDVDKKLGFELACQAYAAVRINSTDWERIDEETGIVFKPLTEMVKAYMADDMAKAHDEAHKFQAGMVELGVCDANLAEQIARKSVEDMNSLHTRGASKTYMAY